MQNRPDGPTAHGRAITVRELRDDERAEAAAITARAFWDDPLFDHFARDPLHQHRLLAELFDPFLGELRDSGARTWVAEWQGRPRALACWLPPGAERRAVPTDPRRVARLAGVLARIVHRRQAVRLLSAVDRAHPHEPHWYLGVLVTDPSAQGRGLGSATIRPALERCDDDGLPAYLETQKESNLAWYARSGFEVREVVRVPGAPPVWCLWREPLAG